MTGTGRPLGWNEIAAYLVEVGTELERSGLTRSIIVVGGAYVAYRGVRASTTDVDTIYELDDELRGAVAAVAERHGLEHDWLNDRALPWRPVTFDPTTCETLVETGGLVTRSKPSSTDGYMTRLRRRSGTGGQAPTVVDLRSWFRPLRGVRVVGR